MTFFTSIRAVLNTFVIENGELFANRWKGLECTASASKSINFGALSCFQAKLNERLVALNTLDRDANKSLQVKTLRSLSNPSQKSLTSKPKSHYTFLSGKQVLVFVGQIQNGHKFLFLRGLSKSQDLEKKKQDK